MLYFVECLSFIDNVYCSLRFKNQGENFCGTIHVKAILLAYKTLALFII